MPQLKCIFDPREFVRLMKAELRIKRIAAALGVSSDSLKQRVQHDPPTRKLYREHYAYLKAANPSCAIRPRRTEPSFASGAEHVPNKPPREFSGTLGVVFAALHSGAETAAEIRRATGLEYSAIQPALERLEDYERVIVCRLDGMLIRRFYVSAAAQNA